MKEESNMTQKERLELIMKTRDVIARFTDQEREAALRFLSVSNDDVVPERIRMVLIQFFNIIGGAANQ